jgi:hypothetical protein
MVMVERVKLRNFFYELVKLWAVDREETIHEERFCRRQQKDSWGPSATQHPG